MFEPSGVTYINGYGPERAVVAKEATGITIKIVQSMLGFITFVDSTLAVNFPHCLIPDKYSMSPSGSCIRLEQFKLRC